MNLIKNLKSIHYWLEVDEHIVEQVRLAIRLQVKIQIDYVDEQQQVSQRQLWPFALGYFNDKMLLAAWCELREDFRNFRLDRILDIQVDTEVFEEVAGQGLSDFFASWSKYD